MTSELSANQPSDIRGAAPGEYWKAFEEKWQSIEPDAVRTFLKDIELTFTFYPLVTS